MTHRFYAAAVIAALTGAACGGTPTAPTRTTTVSSVDPRLPAPVPAATLAITSFDVIEQESSNGVFWYRPALVLTETGGQSAAILRSIRLSMPNHNDYTISQGCFSTPDSKAVARGACWDINSAYTYCLDIDSVTALADSQVEVTVSFADEQGIGGEVRGVTYVKGQQ